MLTRKLHDGEYILWEDAYTRHVITSSREAAVIRNITAATKN